MSSTPKVSYSEEAVRAYGVRLDGVTACMIVYGVGRTRAYEMLRAGEVDFPVLKQGRRYTVPTAAVLSVLGLGGTATAA